MKKSPINLSAAKLKAANVVASTNQFQFGGWTLMYNSAKNPAKFDFTDKKPNALQINIKGSTGWVRLIRPISLPAEPGIYTVSLRLRELSNDPKVTCVPYIFKCPVQHKFEKQCRLTPRDGAYVTKLAISENSPEFWIGFETTDAAAELTLGRVQLGIVEDSRQLVENLRQMKQLELPVVFSEPQSKNYKDLNAFNENFAKNTAKSELPFLLSYAASIRKVEMPETHLRIVRYMVVRYHDFDRPQHDALAKCVTDALLVSHDEQLLDLIRCHCPELLFKLDLNAPTMAQFAMLPSGSEAIPSATLDRHAYFVHQDDPVALFSLVHKKILSHPRYPIESPQAWCAIANAYASRSEHTSTYLAYLNRFLESSHLSHRATALTPDPDNVLRGMSFAPVKPIEQGPLVSVLMSAYNAEQTIEYAIRSLIAQSYRNIEILICDDGSDDETLAIAQGIAREDARVRVFQSKHNQGTYNIRNDLIAEARGEFLTFQDSDDLSLPCRIEAQLETLSNEQKTLCFSRWIRVRPDGSFVFFQDGCLERFCVVSVMAHVSLFERMPAFRSSLVAADTEFYELCKCALGESEIAVDKRPLILGLWGEGSLTRQTNLTADHSGYVAPRRRAYAEIAARQRVLGTEIVRDVEVEEKLKSLDLYREPQGVERVSDVALDVEVRNVA